MFSHAHATFFFFAMEPVRAIVLTWFLTQLVILVGDLDLLLPIVSGCFLICFCAVNLTCFVLELWREGGGGMLRMRVQALHGQLQTLIHRHLARAAWLVAPVAHPLCGVERNTPPVRCRQRR